MEKINRRKVILKDSPLSQVQKSVIQKIQRAYGLLLQETLVQDVFEKEIAQQSVSLEISSLPELQNKSPKRVLDKVC